MLKTVELEDIKKNSTNWDKTFQETKKMIDEMVEKWDRELEKEKKG